MGIGSKKSECREGDAKHKTRNYKRQVEEAYKYKVDGVVVRKKDARKRIYRTTYLL